jgi:hypothetical protein
MRSSLASAVSRLPGSRFPTDTGSLSRRGAAAVRLVSAHPVQVQGSTFWDFR